MYFWRFLSLAAILWVGGSVSASAQTAGHAFRDCPDCPEMVPVRPASFMMGVPAGEEEREGVPDAFKGRSAPPHQVTIGHRFAIGKYDVTRGEFSAFVADTGYRTGDRCVIYS